MAEQTKAKPTRRLTITSQKPLATFVNQKGVKQTIYELRATDGNGQPVDPEKVPLRSFSELQIGEEVEYEIEPYDHPTYGRSYTVKAPSGHMGKRVASLERKVDDLTKRVAAIEGQTGGI